MTNKTDSPIQNRIHAVPMQPRCCILTGGHCIIYIIKDRGMEGPGFHSWSHEKVHIFKPMHGCAIIGVKNNLRLQNLTGEGTVHYFMEFDGVNPP